MLKFSVAAFPDKHQRFSTLRLISVHLGLFQQQHMIESTAWVQIIHTEDVSKRYCSGEEANQPLLVDSRCMQQQVNYGQSQKQKKLLEKKCLPARK